MHDLKERHVYEIIREDCPCRLYLDLDRKREVGDRDIGRASLGEGLMSVNSTGEGVMIFDEGLTNLSPPKLNANLMRGNADASRSVVMDENRAKEVEAEESEVSLDVSLIRQCPDTDHIRDSVVDARNDINVVKGTAATVMNSDVNPASNMPLGHAETAVLAEETSGIDASISTPTFSTRRLPCLENESETQHGSSANKRARFDESIDLSHHASSLPSPKQSPIRRLNFVPTALETPVREQTLVDLTVKQVENHVALILHALAKVLRDRFAIFVSVKDFLVLESTSPTKFSYHVILHVPDGRLFENNVVCGELVDEAHKRLATSEFCEESIASEMIDMGVYTKNRAFRLLWSSKYGKTATFDVARINEFTPCDDFNTVSATKLFYNSLVCPLGVYSAAWAENVAKFLTVKLAPLKRKSKGSSPMKDSSTENIAAAIAPLETSDTSRFLKIDEWVLSLASSNTVGTSACIRERVFIDETKKLKYFMARNRFCRRIGRAHKSNNVIWTVDLRRKIAYQTCLDYDCRGFMSNAVDYWGDEWPIL